MEQQVFSLAKPGISAFVKTILDEAEKAGVAVTEYHMHQYLDIHFSMPPTQGKIDDELAMYPQYLEILVNILRTAGAGVLSFNYSVETTAINLTAKVFFLENLPPSIQLSEQYE